MRLRIPYIVLFYSFYVSILTVCFCVLISAGLVGAAKASVAWWKRLALRWTRGGSPGWVLIITTAYKPLIHNQPDHITVFFPYLPTCCYFVWCLKPRHAALQRMGMSPYTVLPDMNATSSTLETPLQVSPTEASVSNNGETQVWIHLSASSVISHPVPPSSHLSGGLGKHVRYHCGWILANSWNKMNNQALVKTGFFCL